MGAFTGLAINIFRGVFSMLPERLVSTIVDARIQEDHANLNFGSPGWPLGYYYAHLEPWYALISHMISRFFHIHEFISEFIDHEIYHLNS